MITVISRKKERRTGGKAIENYAIEPRGCLSWFCWPKLAQTLCCGSSVWKWAAQNLAMANAILIVLSSAQPSPSISLHHISPSRMTAPWSAEYTGSSFAHVLPVWCTAHRNCWESVLYVCRSRKELTWELQAVSGDLEVERVMVVLLTSMKLPVIDAS